MAEVYTFLKLQLLVTAFLTALLWVLYTRSVRREFFRWWAMAWMSSTVFLLFGVLSVRFPADWGWPKFVLILLATECAFLQVPWLALGAWSLRSGQVEPRWTRLATIGALVAGALTFGLSVAPIYGPETSFFLRSVPRTAAMAAVMLFCAGKLARYWWHRRSSAAAFSAVCCLLYGLNQAVYSLSLTQRLLLGPHGVYHRLLDFRFIAYHEFVLLDVAYTAGLCLALLLLRFEEQRRLEQALLVSDRRAAIMAVRNAELHANIEERRRVEAALSESEAHFRSLAETVSCGIWIYRDSHFLYVNREIGEALGYTHQELMAMEIWDLIHPDFREMVRSRAVQRTDGEAVQSRYEIKIVGRQGEEHWVDLTAEIIQFQGQPAILGTAFDITERKKAEQSLRTLGQRLIHAQEEERARVARELHDNINQRLALLGIAIQQVRRALPESSNGQRSQIDKLWHMADEISHEVQALSHELHSAHLRHLGLAAAVKSAAQEFQESHAIEVECWCLDVPDNLPADVALALFRVVQEALHNTAKYSRARKVRVGVEGLPHALHLEVADDGVGFDPADVAGKGLGLTSMEERVRFIGAQFHLVSAPGAGTRIEVMVPLKAARKPVERQQKALAAHAAM